MKCVCCKFLVLLKMTIFVFSKLIDSLEPLQLLSNRLMEDCSSDGEGASRTRSSAKRRRRKCVWTSSIEPELLSVRNWSKSFMKRLNRRGLRLQPYRIPLLHANDFDSSWFTHILGISCSKLEIEEPVVQAPGPDVNTVKLHPFIN